jgi:hypothetical protein
MKTKPNLTALLKQAAHFLEGGDPCKAVDTLNEALAEKMPLAIRKCVNKAMDEAHNGSPEVAELLLSTALLCFSQKSCADAGRMGGQTGGKAKSAAKTAAARRNAKQGGRPRKPLATLSPQESKVYDDAFVHYMSNVKQDTARADRYAWRKTQEAFSRLKNYSGAKPEASKRPRLFAAVPVPGPPCLKCSCKTTRSVGKYWVCKNGHRELADTSGI